MCCLPHRWQRHCFPLLRKLRRCRCLCHPVSACRPHLGAEADATAREQRGRVAAAPGIASALLLVRLLATAADLAPGQGASRALHWVWSVAKGVCIWCRAGAHPSGSGTRGCFRGCLPGLHATKTASRNLRHVEAGAKWRTRGRRMRQSRAATSIGTAAARRRRSVSHGRRFTRPPALPIQYHRLQQSEKPLGKPRAPAATSGMQWSHRKQRGSLPMGAQQQCQRLTLRAFCCTYTR